MLASNSSCDMCFGFAECHCLLAQKMLRRQGTNHRNSELATAIVDGITLFVDDLGLLQQKLSRETRYAQAARLAGLEFVECAWCDSVGCATRETERGPIVPKGWGMCQGACDRHGLRVDAATCAVCSMHHLRCRQCAGCSQCNTVVLTEGEWQDELPLGWLQCDRCDSGRLCQACAVPQPWICARCWGF